MWPGSALQLLRPRMRLRLLSFQRLLDAWIQSSSIRRRHGCSSKISRRLTPTASPATPFRLPSFGSSDTYPRFALYSCFAWTRSRTQIRLSYWFRCGRRCPKFPEICDPA